MLPKVILGLILVLGLFFISGSYFKDNPPQIERSQPEHQQGSNQKEPNLGAGEAKLFYNKDGQT